MDFHLHLGRMFREHYPQRPALSAAQLVDWMDRQGIEIGVLLPLESPEGGWGYMLTEEAVAARDLYPERLVAFVCADPRYPQAAAQIDYFVQRCGCRGFGEHVNGLAFDDERNRALYAKCDEYALPLVLDMNADMCYDEVGLPGLERCLRDFPRVTFVGHGPRFWAALSGDDDGRTGYPYPGGPIIPGGAVDRLMSDYDNLGADLSAGSGYNALTRDPDYAAGFVQRHWRKLLFGTDYLAPGQPTPIVEWMRTVDLPAEQRQAIESGNARRLLGL